MKLESLLSDERKESVGVGGIVRIVDISMGFLEKSRCSNATGYPLGPDIALRNQTVKACAADISRARGLSMRK